MRVAALTKYGRTGASSRLRVLQYLPALAAAGISLDIHPLFDDAYIDRLNGGRSAGLRVPRYYLDRARVLSRLADYDAVWLQYELFPWLPWLIEARFIPGKIPLAVDYDDATFHRYDRHGFATVRGLLGTKIDRVMARADLVMAGNDYLADRARTAGARRVEIVPTVVDIDRYPPGQPDHDGLPRIGWIGSHSTARYLAMLEPVVTALGASRAIECIAIGAPVDAFGFSARRWTEQSEGSEIQKFTIGVMPLENSDWELGKCGYKLIQYMACGIPVVGSRIGANTTIVRDGIDGFLVSTADEWSTAISRLLNDPALRRRLGEAGRSRVASNYALQVEAPKMATRFRSLLAKP